jgi:hypothetical protein
VKLWTAPARVLPVTVRPLGGETVISYARRLSEANGLRPTTVTRALGQLSCGSGYHLFDREAWLNEQALDRIEAYSGISRERLARVLPALRQRPRLPLPADRPAVYVHRLSPPARPACRRCLLRASGSSGPPVMVHPGTSPLICQRHKRWLGPAGETAQYDLSAAGEILTAARRRTRLLARSPDRKWAAGIFAAAWSMAEDWTEYDPRRMPVFSRRWRDRAAALGITTAEKWPPRVVTFPEAVTLTAILTDLNWRRYVALEWNDKPFYQHVAESIGEQSYPRFFLRNDPIRRWIDGHRARFADTRLRAWRHPVPENRHFK